MAVITLAASLAKRVRRGATWHVFDWHQAAAMTAAANKARFVAPAEGRITSIIAHSNAAGSGGTSTIFDVNINGTTVFLAAGKATLLAADSGYYTTSALDPDNVKVKAGDIISIDCDQISTTGPTLTAISISLGGN